MRSASLPLQPFPLPPWLPLPLPLPSLLPVFALRSPVRIEQRQAEIKTWKIVVLRMARPGPTCSSSNRFFAALASLRCLASSRTCSSALNARIARGHHVERCHSRLCSRTALGRLQCVLHSLLLGLICCNLLLNLCLLCISYNFRCCRLLR